MRWKWKQAPSVQEMEKIAPFVNDAHRASYAQARAINPQDAITVVNDMINYLGAQDAGRRNGYDWSDTHIVNSLRIKLNVWILARIGRPPLPVEDRPPNGTKHG